MYKLLLDPVKYSSANIHGCYSIDYYYPVANCVVFPYCRKPEPEIKVDYP